MENIDEQKFQIYLTILRFLPFKITTNLKRIYLDINFEERKATLTAFYLIHPSELELELLDDICTDSKAHLPELYVDSKVKLIKEHINKPHDFVVFSVYENISDMLV